MSEFEPFDDQLGEALRRRAGDSAMSTAAAHDAVLSRAGTIRRRRAAIGGAGAMAVLLLGGIALLPRGNDEIGPLDDGEVLPTFEQVTTTEPDSDESDESGAAPDTVDLTIPDVDTTPPTSIDLSVPTSKSVPITNSVPTSNSVPITNSVPTSNSVATTDSAATSSTPDTTAPEPTLAPFTTTYQSVGGSITVNWNGSTLTLQAVSPASGFVGEVEESSATRVRVRFEGADADSRIEVRVDGGVERVVIS